MGILVRPIQNDFSNTLLINNTHFPKRMKTIRNAQNKQTFSGNALHTRVGLSDVTILYTWMVSIIGQLDVSSLVYKQAMLSENETSREVTSAEKE